MKNDEIVLRVKELIRDMRLSDGKFSDAIKMDRSAFSKRMRGKPICGEGFINRIVIELGVSKRWLTDGVGEKYIQERDKDNNSIAAELESELVVALRAENNKLSRALLDKMNELSEVRDTLHKYEIEELKGQIAQSEIRDKKAKAS